MSTPYFTKNIFFVAGDAKKQGVKTGKVRLIPKKGNKRRNSSGKGRMEADRTRTETENETETGIGTAGRGPDPGVEAEKEGEGNEHISVYCSWLNRKFFSAKFRVNFLVHRL